MLDKIVKRVIFYLLIISLIVNGYFILKSYYLDNSMLNNIYKPPKIIPKKEIVKVKGKVKTETKKEPYAIVIDRIDGKYNINFDESIIPDNLTVDDLDIEKSFNWLEPIKIGIETNYYKSKFNFSPVIFYNPINYRNFEIGINTNFSSIGANISYNLLNSNLNLFLGYYLDNTITFGVNLNIW